jgi:enamine deaminase RidA (YjgF/YER057c/UK114 family)
MRRAFWLAALVVVPALGAQQREILQVPGAVAGLPFSPAVRVGDVIYLSGQIGNRIEVYASFFPKDPPARSTVAGSGLALGARVEIECMAVRGER